MNKFRLTLFSAMLLLLTVACGIGSEDIDGTVEARIASISTPNIDATVQAVIALTPTPTPKVVITEIIVTATPVVVIVTPTPTPDEATLMNSLLTVELIEKEILPEDSSVDRYSDLIRFTLRYQAVGDIGIRAFTGIMRFEDVFGRHIKSLSLTYDDPLIAGQVVVDRNKTFDPNQFIDEDMKLQNTELENLVVTFQPKSILLADGRQLGSVDQ